MSGVELTIKDANGKILLNLTNRITRLTQTLVRSTPANSLAATEFIVLGAAADRNKFWHFVRFAQTKRNNGLDFAPIGAFSAFIATRAEIQASNLYVTYKNKLLNNMQANYTYLIIDDGREDVYGLNIVNTCTINVGMY